MVIFGVTFLQYFSSMPLYYKDVHALSELQIGLLLGFNGFLIFMLEMPLIKWLDESKYSKEFLMLFGLFLTGASFLVLNLFSWTGILIVGMFLMTIGEMIAFPFSNAFVMERAKRGNQGEYMGYYSIAFSIAHVFGHNSGLQMINALGFDKTWFIISILSVIGMLFLFVLMRMIKKEKQTV